MSFIASITKKIDYAPTAPGVYFFLRHTKVLYIGKAANLRQRLRSYVVARDPKTAALHHEATRVTYTALPSPVAALIEEAKLIRRLKPELNTIWQDDKNYFYVAFTKEKFPKVYVTHQPKLEIETIGPFTDGGALRSVLKIIRRSYPYCTCLRPHLRQCLNAHLGLCRGICCRRDATASPADRHNYRHTIQTIRGLLLGRKKSELLTLVGRAGWAASRILEHQPFLEHGTSTYTIECYDISNYAGKEAVGAFTVLAREGNEWKPRPNRFRKFRIKEAPTRDDPRMIAEILRRRLRHPEWPYPDLIIIDGGITQYNAARATLEAHWPSASAPPALISFAKPEQRVIGNLPPDVGQEIIQQSIDQTHRYVIRYHRRLRDKITL